MGVAPHFMPTLGSTEAILLGSAQPHSFTIVVERLFTIKMSVLPLLSAILIHGRLHFHSGRWPILRGGEAEYEVTIMRRRWADIISMGMDYITDAAELSLPMFGWLPTIAEVPWFRGVGWPFLAVGSKAVYRWYIGISMNGQYEHEMKIFQGGYFIYFFTKYAPTLAAY